MPELLAMGFETKQRVIRTPSFLPRVVTQTSALLVAIERQHHRIQIEEDTRRGRGQSEKLLAQLIVQAHQLTNGLRRKSLQESPQCGLVGKALQPQQRQKRTVVLKNLGLIDAAQSGHERIQQSQDQVARLIFPEPLRDLQTILQPPAQAEPVAKSLDQHHPAEVSQAVVGEGKTQSFQAFWHDPKTKIPTLETDSQTYLLGRFVKMMKSSTTTRKKQGILDQITESSRIFEV